ncbi:MAG: hypothetical protein JRJ49_00230, partial [Deltaproteobacteria bacterium]|nr:hypothetical protein [Deltaproteobacteria bacterium]
MSLVRARKILPIFILSISFFITSNLTNPILSKALDIVADKSAAPSNQAGMDAASNGVRLINIVAPSVQGVS